MPVQNRNSKISAYPVSATNFTPNPYTKGGVSVKPVKAINPFCIRN